MKNLQILSTQHTLKKGYLEFSASDENNKEYVVAIAISEIESFLSESFGTEIHISKSQIQGEGAEDFRDVAQDVLDAWERSNFKDTFLVEAVAAKVELVEFTKKNKKGSGRPALETATFPISVFPTVAAQNKFKNQNGFDSFRVVTK